MRCTTSFDYAWNITACSERPTRSVAIHLNWKLQDRSFATGSLWPRAATSRLPRQLTFNLGGIAARAVLPVDNVAPTDCCQAGSRTHTHGHNRPVTGDRCRSCRGNDQRRVWHGVGQCGFNGLAMPRHGRQLLFSMR